MFSKQRLELPKVAPAFVSPVRSESHQAHGAFTPTSSAFPSLRHIADSTAGTSLFSTFPGLRRRRRPAQLVWRIDYEPLSQSDVSASTPSSPTSLFSAPAIIIPSISRTTPFTPSGETSPTTSFSTLSYDHDDRPKPSPATITLKDVDVLVRLEKSSKFCKRRAQCSGCGKVGADYPRCNKCGDMWCSRDCRLHGPGGDGKRHICGPSRTSSPDLKDCSRI